MKPHVYQTNDALPGRSYDFCTCCGIRAIRYGFYLACYLVLIGAVLLPFVTGFGSVQEFWGL